MPLVGAPPCLPARYLRLEGQDYVLCADMCFPAAPAAQHSPRGGPVVKIPPGLKSFTGEISANRKGDALSGESRGRQIAAPCLVRM